MKKKLEDIKRFVFLGVLLLFVLSQFAVATWQQCLVEQHPQPAFTNSG
ncbi:MAG: hypothetical protein KAW12_20015 [Candidatus Aminicenantes bacterium]|nr:hypothetical protein [Candidatus Aminicenantes bacterium]